MFEKEKEAVDYFRDLVKDNNNIVRVEDSIKKDVGTANHTFKPT